MAMKFKNGRPTKVATVALIFGRSKTQDRYTRYAISEGFLATPLLLQWKARPEWQRGKLNGPGGRVEKDEQPGECILREVHEETSLVLQEARLFARLHCETPSEDYSLVYFYWAWADTKEMERAVEWSFRHAPDEPLRMTTVKEVLNDDSAALLNLRWMTQMARNMIISQIVGQLVEVGDREQAQWFDIYEQYEEEVARK